MDELNFTTFNSFMHYGVKGMKWGVINFDNDDLKNIKSRLNNKNEAIKSRLNNKNEIIKSRLNNKNGYIEKAYTNEENNTNNKNNSVAFNYSSQEISSMDEEQKRELSKEVESKLNKYCEAADKLINDEEKFNIFMKKYRNDINNAINTANLIVFDQMQKDPNNFEEYKSLLYPCISEENALQDYKRFVKERMEDQ